MGVFILVCPPASETQLQFDWKVHVSHPIQWSAVSYGPSYDRRYLLAPSDNETKA